MLIDGVYLVTNNNQQDFINNVCDDVGKLQERGLEVDIQYKTVFTGAEIVYTALILGRREPWVR